MDNIITMFEHMSFFAGIGAVASTAVTIFLYMMYSEKKLSTAEATGESLDNYWYLGLFVTEVYGYALPSEDVQLNLFSDAIFFTIFDILGNILFFFICYGILSLIGVDKENKFERCKKAFMGLVILSVALIFLYEKL